MGFPIYLVFSAIAAYLLTPFVRAEAIKRNWTLLVPPDHHHPRPASIPRLGGVAVYLAFCCTGLIYIARAITHYKQAADPLTLLAVMLPATIVFATGLYDDFYGASPWLKIAVEVLAGLMLFAAGLRIDVSPGLFGAHSLGMALSAAATVLWVLFITNAFNLIDGLDGLASGAALFPLLTLLIISLRSNEYLFAFTALSLTGAILGFLRYNLNPATIFLGDCGSLFLGFMLSAVSLMTRQKTPTLVSIAIPLVAFGLPVLDTTLSIIRRFLSGKPVMQADRGHIHHRLLDRGFSQRKAVLVLYGVSAAFGAFALVMFYPGARYLGVMLLVVGAVAITGIQLLGYHETTEVWRLAQRTWRQRRIMANNILVHRAVGALQECASLEAINAVLAEMFSHLSFERYALVVHLAGQRQETFEWQRRERRVSQRSQHHNPWVLSIDLLAGETASCIGRLEMARRLESEPLLVDVNLLVGELATALARATERALGGSAPVDPARSLAAKA